MADKDDNVVPFARPPLRPKPLAEALRRTPIPPVAPVDITPEDIILDTFGDRLKTARAIPELFAFQYLAPLRRHVLSVEGHVSDRTIEMRRHEVRKLSDDELRDAVRNSNELAWNLRPAYFVALLLECDARKL